MLERQIECVIGVSHQLVGIDAETLGKALSKHSVDCARLDSLHIVCACAATQVEF